MKNSISDEEFEAKIKKALCIVAPIFVVLFLASAAFIFLGKGYAVDSEGIVSLEPYKYLHNLIEMPAVLVMFVVGVVLVLAGAAMGIFSKSNKGVWPFGFGVVLTVMALFFVAGFNGTAYYPSCTDLQSSLTLANSCSSEFTLKVMAYVSIAIPFVLAYIVYAWRAIDRKSITRAEIEQSEDKY